MLFLGLGSNAGERDTVLRRCISLLSERIGSVMLVSSVMESEPWGYESPHLYLNEVVGLETTLMPLQVLDRTEGIERELGRIQKSHNGVYRDRTLDIDLLLWDDLIMDTSRLKVPHPLMHERLFVLKPLAEIAPYARHPIFNLTVSQMLSRISQS